MRRGRGNHRERRGHDSEHRRRYPRPAEIRPELKYVHGASLKRRT